MADAQCDGHLAPSSQRRSLADARCWSAVQWRCQHRGDRITWTQSEFCTWQNSVRGQEPPKCIYSAPVQETAKHRAKFRPPPLSDVGAVTKPTCETRWNLVGCPKPANRSQPVMDRSSPYCGYMWRRYCCLTSIFPIVYTCFDCEDTGWQICAMVPIWLFFASCISSESVQHISDLHSKFALRPHHVPKYGRHQHDGRPAEYRWRPVLNAAKFGSCLLLECRAVTLPRRETRWNLQGCPKLANRSQWLVGLSSPYCEDIWKTYCCLTSFFPIVDTCLSCEDIARQNCAMVPRRWFFGSCISSEPRAAGFRPSF